MDRPIPNVAISASAGSGKTYQLSHRYIALMAAGVEADRICALTFARKASGEIFDSIVRYLCEAALSAEGAARTAREIGRPERGPAAFGAMLRAFVERMPRLRIGTLDSFIVGVIRAFPVELGVPPDFALTDEKSSAAREVQEAALTEVFFPRRIDEATRRRFLEAFKQATFGRAEKGVRRNLFEMIRDLRERYKDLPDRAAWGVAATVWPEGCPWLAGGADPAAASASADAALAATDWPDAFAAKLRDFVAFAGTYTEESIWPQPFPGGDTLCERLFEAVEDLRAGGAEIRYRRRAYTVPAPLAGPLYELVRHLMRIELRRALNRTQGIFRVMDLYEALYDAAMRRRGCLTFQDAQYLLAGGGGGLLSREADAEGRIFIDYRLDAHLDHWLLDEFQDTSDRQWAVLANLADEVFSDQTGERSFFYVGDVKQAIYGWRGGNAQLFDEVYERYESRIEPEQLARSFRSCAPVIEAVNDVFGDLSASGLPERAVTRWARIWQEHQPASTVEKLSGYAALLEPRYEGGEKPTAEDRYALAAALLRQLDPVGHGLEVAVLVRGNDAGRAVVDHLRRRLPDVPVVHEGPAAIRDNPVVALLAAVLRWSAHPGDLLAQRHIEMSPLAGAVATAGRAGEEQIVALREQVERAGLRRTLAHWAGELERVSPLDAFGRARLEELLALATDFEAAGSSGVDAFLATIEEAQTRDIAQPGAIRVMTVHQAKGLGFDVVLLPDLESRVGGRGGEGNIVVGRNERSNAWALAMPRRLIAHTDPVLRAARETAEEQEAFDALCVLYVALTRARRGLYVISSYPGKTSQATTLAAVMKRVLLGTNNPPDGPEACWGGEACTCLREWGDPEWCAGLPRTARTAEAEEEPSLPRGYGRRQAARQRPARIEPSRAEHRVPIAHLFDRETSDVLAFGTAIHALFEGIEWIEDADIDVIVHEWTARSTDRAEVRRDVVRQFRVAVAQPAVRAALSRPREPRVELWRERPFEILLEEGWVSGVFDRVVIRRDGKGRARSAEILDYKSNRVTEEADLARTAEGYRPQMELYRRVLSQMFGLPPEAIALRLLFTVTGRVWMRGRKTAAHRP